LIGDASALVEGGHPFTSEGGWRMLRLVGLVLFALLVFFGLRRTPVRQAAAYCLLTALLLTLLSVGAMDGQPGCHGLGCKPTLSGLAVAFVMARALAFLSFGFGTAIRRFIDRTKKA
jgi:hypothetical protein